MAIPDDPITRRERFYSSILGDGTPPDPITREEMYLYEIAQNGGGGGGGGTAGVTSVNGQTGAVVLTKSDLNLGNVDNTSDENKPISTETQTALSGKLDKSGGTMSGSLAMGSNRITGLAAGVNDTDAVSKGQLDLAASRAANRYLELIDLGTFANGTEFQSRYTSSGMKADISSGAFQKALTGCKVTINGHVYYFAHPDYWYRTGDTGCTTHHMLVVPAENLSYGQMNSTNVTTGAYIGSDMYTGNNGNTALADAKAIIRADFGADNILTHRELFANSTSGNNASSWIWRDSSIDLMNESMVYGSPVCGKGVDGSANFNVGIDKCQLKLFAERPDLITTRAAWWLRGVVSSADFAFVDGGGIAGYYNASYSFGVRPAFAIC